MLRTGWIAIALLAAGCSSESGGDGDGDVEGCLDANEIEIGRCVVDATGAACTSSNEDDQRFEPVAEGSTVPMALGFQGLNMFAMALRTPEIEPGGGDPTLDPLINARVTMAGMELTSYQREVPFVAAGGEFEMLHTFMAIQFGAEDLIGVELLMDAVVTDSAGEMRCGRVGFIGGQIE